MQFATNGVHFSRFDNFMVVYQRVSDGKKFKYYNTFPDYESIPNGCRFFGIFKVDNSCGRRGGFNRFIHEKRKRIKTEGVPEGKMIYINSGKAVLCKESSNCYRKQYKRSLEKILKKVQDLVDAGVDKKTAIKAAIRCKCK